MEQVFLYIMMWSWGHKSLDLIEMSSPAICLTTAEEMRSDISDDPDLGSGVAVFCDNASIEPVLIDQWIMSEQLE